MGNSELVSRKKVATAVCGAVCLVALLSTGVAMGEGNGARLQENAAAQTFGTIAEAESSGQVLDLVEVQATNGRIGYVYHDELIEAETHGVRTPEDAERAMIELEKASNEALADQLSSLLPSGSEVSVADAKAYLDATVREPIAGVTAARFETQERQAVEALADSVDLAPEQVQGVVGEAFLRAQEQVQVVIPVYEADGVTCIGEFAVGSLM